mgnify:CR=1 FL=1
MLGGMSAASASRPPRPPRQARGHARVARLLDAAAAELAESGVAALHMDAVARRAGTARGSLYQFFPNKEALLDALAARYADALAAVHAAMLPAEAPAPGDRVALATVVAAVVRDLAAFHDAHPGFHRLVMADASASPLLARRIETIRATLIARLGALLHAYAPACTAAERTRRAWVMVAVGQGVLLARDAAPVRLRAAMLRDLEGLLVAFIAGIAADDAPTTRPGRAAAPRRQAPRAASSRGRVQP